ncbi:hypothetical protein Taro_019829 [Colocasia esculenta]|uniref:Uncharacterized protein n=1 Tax=Colocasia esculenta TaxID=4460 RepID=A0A843UM19_COLES|nr:hypothetical protein [Colocasia esculenta]
MNFQTFLKIRAHFFRVPSLRASQIFSNPNLPYVLRYLLHHVSPSMVEGGDPEGFGQALVADDADPSRAGDAVASNQAHMEISVWDLSHHSRAEEQPGSSPALCSHTLAQARILFLASSVANVVRHITSGVGTLLMLDRKIEAFIFSLFNKDLKARRTSKRNFGLFMAPSITLASCEL